MKEQEYDSEKDTNEHVQRVRALIAQVIQNLDDRAMVHDVSKYGPIEKPLFDKVTPRLKGLTYGSDEYRASLKELGVALEHHYANNSHHPEHYENGIAGMSLLDLVEMFCDWKAATERHADGSIANSIEHNKARFGYPDMLASIFHNTIKELDWGDR